MNGWNSSSGQADADAAPSTGAERGAPGAVALGADPGDDDERYARDRPEGRRRMQRHEPDRGLEAHQRAERCGRQPPQRKQLERVRDGRQQDREAYPGEVTLRAYAVTRSGRGSWPPLRLVTDLLVASA